jgi:hypothetical protein
MKRTNFYFPEQMLKRLRAAAKKTGLPVSELLRRGAEYILSKLGL